MPPNSTPSAEAVLALQMLSYRTLAALVSKGLLEPHEAANAATEAANDVRLGTENEPNEANGEQAARGLEQVAEWLLKCQRNEEGN